MLRPEQKSVKRMSALVQKFTRPGDLVFDPFAGTFSVPKACLSRAKHRRFVGGDLDEGFVATAYPHVLATFVHHALKEESDVRVPSTALHVMKKFAALNKNRVVDIRQIDWGNPPGCPPLQFTPRHILDSMTSLHRIPPVGRSIRVSTMDSWPGQIQKTLATCDMEALLLVDCFKYKVVVAPSKIRHHRVGYGLFTTQARKTGDVVLPFYGTLLYKDVGSMRVLRSVHGFEPYTVTPELIRKFAVQLRDKVDDRKGASHEVYVCPAPFCASRYINDPRYNVGDPDMSLPMASQRTPNLKLVESSQYGYGVDAKSLRNVDLLVFEAARDIAEGDELYWDYGPEYMFD